MKLMSNFKQTIKIGEKEIGDNKPIFIVVETGVTACGSIEFGKALIDKAIEAGADAIKFQTIDCDEFMADKTVMFKYETIDGIKEENMYEMLKKHQFNEAELIELADYAKKAGIIFYLTVDTVRSVAWAEAADVPAYKIGSWDLRNYPLLEAVAKTGKPIQLDLGPVIMGEIVQILEFIEKHGAEEVMLVYCSHASEAERLNLNSIPYLKDLLGIPIGFSADTREMEPDILSVALGSRMIEKRLTLNRNFLGHHHIKALEPEEFNEWVKSIRSAEAALGKKMLNPSIEDLSMKNHYFTSVVAIEKIAKGEIITREKLGAKRPGTGISPIYMDQIVNKKAKRFIGKNEVITWEDWSNLS